MYVGDKSPLWCCVNAMNTDHDCCYSLCHACYTNRPSTRAKRKKPDGVSGCDHDNLEVETRSDYFNPIYLQNCQVRGKSTPSHCSHCYKLFTSYKYMAAC